MFSVIIPNYNREDKVTEAIHSVLNQTREDFELIVVDDASTDSSWQVINSIKDDRIKPYILDQNSGAAAARNLGIAKSKGRYISFLDSDDSYEPEFLDESYKLLENTNKKVGFSWTGVRYFNNNDITNNSWTPYFRETAYLTFLYNLQIGIGAGIMLKREIFHNCGGFNEQMPAAEDTEFFLRISQRYDYTFTKKVLINIFKNSNDRLSTNLAKNAEGYNILIKQHLNEISKHSNLKKKYYYKLMWLNYHLKNKAESRYYFRMIPKESLSDFLRYTAIFLIYECLPPNLAYKVHCKLAKIK